MSGVATVQRIADLLAECHDDPVLFNDAVLHRPPYWSRQEEICRSVVTYRVTVAYTGNMTGKDYAVGGIVPWWLWTRPGALSIVTGPSQTLLGSVTWKEIRRAVEGSKILSAFRPRISRGVKASPQVLELAPGWQALGFSTTGIERASGQHAREVLAIVEEASGVIDEVWDAVDSWGYQRLLVILNPVRAEGRAIDLIRQAERDKAAGVPPAEAVNAIRIPSTDSPHAAWDRSPVSLADRPWIEEMTRRYGADSLWVRSHIKAEIPSVSSDSLIPESHLDFAARPDTREIPESHPIFRTRRIACDLGEGVGRDSSAIVVRDDWRLLDVVYGSTLGLPEAAEQIWRLKAKWDVPDERISYDRVGIGRDFHPHLLRRGISGARGYAGEASPASTDFTNLRTEAAWRLKQRLDPRHVPDHREPMAVQPWFHIPPGPYWYRLRSELKALTYDLAGRKTRLLPKEQWCEVLGHSPDLADALIQSFAW